MIKRRIVTVEFDGELSILKSGGSYFIMKIPLYRPSAVGVKEEENYECDREETECRGS
ncbi:MAG: hypothetical protein RXR08_12905 [Sulfolobaceae archaeon]